MAKKSAQRFLSPKRTSRPSVRLTCRDDDDREVELPFVLGVMGDFGADSPMAALDERKFLAIDRDTFDHRFSAIRPRLSFVARTSDDRELPVDLDFEHLDDFHPDALIRRLDGVSADDLNAVLHHQKFQNLESSWRGLNYLVAQVEPGAELKIEFISIKKRELLDDFRGSADLGKSFLYRRILEQEFDQFGFEPYTAIIGDFEFSNDADDLSLMEFVSEIAALAHSPFLAATAPELLAGNSDHADPGTEDQSPALSQDVLDWLIERFDSPEYERWRDLRDTDKARYLYLTTPRVLARYPHGHGVAHSGTVISEFEETIQGSCDCLWMSAAYALAARLADAYRRHGWFGRIRGVHGGGAIEGLPSLSRVEPLDPGLPSGTTERSIPPRAEAGLSSLGLVPVTETMTASGSEPYFASVASFARPRPYHRSEVTKAELITSSRLDYVLCCARVAHYLILIATGRFGFGIFNDILEPDQMANLLNQWIHEYVALDPSNASEDQQAKRPLAEAAVEVEDIAGNPGHYMATVTVRPHYQFEGLPATATVHRVRLFGVNSIHG